jgi:hypothetical protein
MDLWQSPQYEKARQLSNQLNKLLGTNDMFPLLLRVLNKDSENVESVVGPEVLLDNMESLIKGINDRMRYYKKLEEENIKLKLMLNTTLNVVNTLTIPELRAKQQQVLSEKNKLATKKILSVTNERRESTLPSLMLNNVEVTHEDNSSQGYSDEDSDQSSYCTEDEEEYSEEESDNEEEQNNYVQPSLPSEFSNFRFPVGIFLNAFKKTAETLNMRETCEICQSWLTIIKRPVLS